MKRHNKKRICFIGLGNMGTPMAENLLRGGHEVYVHDLDKEKVSRLVKAGALNLKKLSQMVYDSELVITSLPGPDQVTEVYLSDDSILSFAKEGAVFIDTSTSSVMMAQQIAEKAAELDLKFLEAPLSNAVDGAKLGTLTFFVAGEEKLFKDNMPLFELLGEKIFFTGKYGNGSITKLITNLLWFIHSAAIGEGLMLGAKAEIPLETVWASIKASAGNSWVAEHDIPSIFAGHYDPSFSLELCCKDLKLAHEVAADQGVELSMGSLAQEIFEKAKQTYGGSAPELSIVRLLEERYDQLLRPSKPEKIAVIKKSQVELMKEAHAHMPQGVAENYRYWGDKKTVFVKSSKGYQFVDADGKSYCDFRLGYGPIILGYADERVDRAVINQIRSGGVLSGFATELDTKVAKQIKELCPNIEKLRFANSGTEAVMGAVRCARGFTKRNRIAIVEGGFHGLYDEMMWKSDMENWDPAKTRDPNVIPFGAGIPASTRDLVDLIPLNCFSALDELFKKRGEELACIVLEPIIGNCGSISAQANWLKTLKEKCTANGTLLILDEVKTGFRVAKGGAQELYGIHADLTTYAKAMGNGYPVAAFGGRAEVMNVIGSHSDGVIHGGTYTGNLIGLSAAHATLDILKNTKALSSADFMGEKIQNILGKVFTNAGVECCFAGPNTMFGIHFTSSVPTNYRDWRQTDSKLYESFAWNLIENGLMLEPDSREPWFICESHKDMDLSWLEDIATKSIKRALERS